MSAAGEIELRKKRTQVGRGERTGEPVALRNASAAPAAPGKPTVPRQRSRSVLPLVLLLVMTTGWALAASWYAWTGREAVLRLTDEQAELKVAHEERIKALTRRLVGVASYQNLEQDGLAGRLAEILTRQAQLETRQAALVGLGDRLQGIVSAGKGDAPKAPGDPAPGDARPGAAGAAPEAPRAPGQRSAIEPLPDLPTSPAARPRLPPAFARLTPREQFAAMERGLAQLERSQMRVLASFGGAVQGGVTVIREAITQVGLKAELDKPAAPPAPAAKAAPSASARKLAADPFDESFAKIEQGFGDLARWRVTADAVPFRAPLGFGGVTSNFGTRKDPFTGAAKMHAGMDFRSPTGTPILAGGNGKVITAGETGGYGNLVEVDHGNSVITRYGHMSAINVTVGQAVAGGTTVLGLVGSTGRSTGPHLHYETRVAGTPVDPGVFIKVGGNLYETPTKADDADAAEPSHD